MSRVSPEEVERVAALAALQVEPDALSGLTEQIARILEYISQLEAVEAEPPEALAPWVGEDRPRRLRPDEVRAPDLQRDLESFGTALKDSLFVVPKLSALDDA